MEELRSFLEKFGVIKEGEDLSVCLGKLSAKFGKPTEDVAKDVLAAIYECQGRCVYFPQKQGKALFDYQRKIVEHLYLNRGAITSFATGTGKTITAISTAACLHALCKLLGKPIDIVFVTPASLVNNMKNAIKDYPYDFGKSYKVVSSNVFRDAMLLHKMKGMATPRRDVKFMGQKEKHSHIVCGKNTFLIVDEAHEMKTDYEYNFAEKPPAALPDPEDVASRAKMFIEECSPKVWRILLMTATPMMNRWYDIMNLISSIKNVPPKAMIPTVTISSVSNIRFMFPHLLKYVPGISLDLWKAMGSHERDYVPGTLIEGSGMEYPIIIRPEYYRETVMFKDVDYTSGLFPTRTDRYFGAKMTMEYWHEYSKLEKKLKGRPKKKKAESDDQESLMALLQKGISKIPNNPKNEIVRHVISSGQHDKIAIYSRFLIPLRALKEELDKTSNPLGFESFIITGQDVPPNKRDALLQRINSTKKAIIYLSDAGGQGLDFKEITYSIVYEPSVNDSREEQFIGRAVRFRSHTHLPKEKQHVTVLRLYLLAPDVIRNKVVPSNRVTKQRDTTVMPDQWIIGNNSRKSAQSTFFRKQLELMQL